MQIDWAEIRDWISDHWLEPAGCSVCGSPDWDLLEQMIWEIRLATPGGGLRIGGNNPPLLMIALVCQSCKHFEFFSVAAIAKAIADEHQKGENNGR